MISPATRRARPLTFQAGFLVGRGAPISRPDAAADLLWLLVDPRTYQALVHERGRTEQQMADWPHATVAQQLLSAS